MRTDPDTATVIKIAGVGVSSRPGLCEVPLEVRPERAGASGESGLAIAAQAGRGVGRYDTTEARLSNTMKIELTIEERQALFRLVNDALESPRFPLSPEIETLRHIGDKLQGDKTRKPSRG
jgi:hypothetical protein